MINIFKLPLALILSTSAIISHAETDEMNIPETADALIPYQASYTLFRKGSELGKGQRKLTKTSTGYHLSSSSNIKWMFLSDTRKENSAFTIENDIFAPITYHYERTGTGRDREENITFEKENIKSIYKNNEENFKKIQLTYDPLIYQLALRKDLIDDNKVLSYHMIKRCKETQYTFRKLGTETIKTPMGRFEAIKLQRVRTNSTRNTLIWIAPSLNYTVVKMTQFKDGAEQADLQLSWLHFEDKT